MLPGRRIPPLPPPMVGSPPPPCGWSWSVRRCWTNLQKYQGRRSKQARNNSENNETLELPGAATHKDHK